MNTLEERLRRSFHAQADAGAGRSPDLAGRAIRRARSVRRRRAAVAACAAVAVMAAGGFGLVTHHTRSTGTAPANPAPSVLPSGEPSVQATGTSLSLLARHADGTVDVVTPTGAVVPFGTGNVWHAWQVPDGYVIQTDTALYLLRPDRSKTRLVSGTLGVAVTTFGKNEGFTVAWATSDRMALQRYFMGQVTESQSTVAPTKGYPLLYSGKAVYLGGSQTGGGVDRHDVWLPAQGDYHDSFDQARGVSAVDGVLPDNSSYPDSSFFGLAFAPGGGKAQCLATFDEHLAVLSRGPCDPAIVADRSGRIAQDDRHVAVSYLVDGGYRAAVFDLGARAGSRPVVLPLIGEWEWDGDALVGDGPGGQVWRYNLDGSGRPIATPAAGTKYMVIPRA